MMSVDDKKKGKQTPFVSDETIDNEVHKPEGHEVEPEDEADVPASQHKKKSNILLFVLAGMVFVVVGIAVYIGLTIGSSDETQRPNYDFVGEDAATQITQAPEDSAEINAPSMKDESFVEPQGNIEPEKTDLFADNYSLDDTSNELGGFDTDNDSYFESESTPAVKDEEILPEPEAEVAANTSQGVQANKDKADKEKPEPKVHLASENKEAIDALADRVNSLVSAIETIQQQNSEILTALNKSNKVSQLLTEKIQTLTEKREKTLNHKQNTDTKDTISKQNLAKPLAWVSYVDGFGIATVIEDGSEIKIKRGTQIRHRGRVKDVIGSSGCIVFENGSEYAPEPATCE